MELQERQLKNICQIVGNNIRKYRKAAGFSQGDFSNKIRFSQSTLSNIELGHQNVDFNDLAEIAYELHIPISYLFEGAQYERGDTLYSKLEQEYKFLAKKHESLLKELSQIMKRNT